MDAGTANYRRKIALCLLPIAFVLSGLSFNRAKYSNDPEYIYLVNALNISKGKAVGHFDNPGTTVMQLGFVVVYLTHLFDSTSTESLVNEVLKDPDKYIEAFSTILILMCGLMLLLAGYFTFRRTGWLWAALLIQTAPFFSTNILEHAWTKTSPEPMLLMVSLVFSMALIWYANSENKGTSPWPWVFGLIAGFGFATKVTFLPLFLVPFLIWPDLRFWLRYLIMTLAAFLLFTIPAWPVLPNMLGWLYKLMIHTGTYGQGAYGFIDSSAYLASLIAIVRNNTFYIFIVCGGMAALVFSLLRNGRSACFSNNTFRLLLALIVAHLFGIAMVAKHYQHNHYLIPVMALIGITVYLIIRLLTNLISAAWFKRALVASFAAFFIIYFVFSSIPYLRQANNGYKITNLEFNTTFSTLSREYPDYTLVYYYPVSINKFSALKFGNVYGHSVMLSEIKAMYPDVLFCDVQHNRIESWEECYTAAELKVKFKQKLLLAGGPLNASDELKLKVPGLTFEPVYQGRAQAVYKIGFADESNASDIEAPADSVLADMESLSFDKHFVLSGNLKFKLGNTLSNEKSRSGQAAVRLDSQDVFSLEHIIGRVTPGDKYRLTIWRFADNNDGHLVAASTPGKDFYLQIAQPVETDQTGWKKLSLEFEIPPDFGPNQLKIYVWNAGSSVVFFDDLLIEQL